MKFTKEQIEEFRYGLGTTTEAAEQAMQEVAELIEAQIRSEIDEEALRDGDSFYRGMARAVDIAGRTE